MKKRKNSGVLFMYCTLIFGLVTASLLARYIMKDSQEKAYKIVEDTYIRASFRIISTYPDITDDQMQYLKEEITGLVIIDEFGETIYDYGIIRKDPRLFDWFEKDTDKNNISFAEKNDLIFVDIIPELLVRPEYHDLFDRLPSFEEKKLHIHIEFHDESLTKKIKRIEIQYGFIQFFLITFFTLTLLSTRRGEILKNRLDEQQSLVILGTALRTLTHEMKNPLSGIRLQGSFLKKKYPQIEEKEIQLIFGEVDRLTRLMDSVRDFLKAPAEESQTLSLNSALEELRTSFPTEINWVLADNDVYIDFDRDRFRSVIENLLNNAVESGSALSEISVYCMVMKKTVNISVRDKGAGIPRDVEQRIFDPFYTTKTKGSGVGLMVVKKFLDEKNCSLKIKSGEDEGTTVSFWLPLVKKDKGKKINESPDRR